MLIALALAACADSTPPICSDLGCAADPELCRPQPLGPDTECACDGVVCEPRAEDCCGYMPDVTAVAVCERFRIPPGTCGRSVCLANGGGTVLVVFCSGTGDEPTCASLGCPHEPSGTENIWTPCDPDSAFCYCRNGAEDVVGTRCIRG